MSEEIKASLPVTDQPVYREVGLEMRNRAMAYLSEKRASIDKKTDYDEITRKNNATLRRDLSNALVDLTGDYVRCDRVSNILDFYIQKNFGFVDDIFRSYDNIGMQIAAELEEDAIEAYICLREIDLGMASRYSGRFEKLARDIGCETIEELIGKYEAARADRLARAAEESSG